MLYIHISGTFPQLRERERIPVIFKISAQCLRRFEDKETGKKPKNCFCFFLLYNMTAAADELYFMHGAFIFTNKKNIQTKVIIELKT